MPASSFASPLVVLVLAAPALLLGCDEDTMADDDEAEARDCTNEPRADTYTLGLRRAGHALTVQFVDAMPAPPERGDNTWTVMVTDEHGAGIDDLAVAAMPFMPDHGHGTTVATTVTPGSVAGEYVLSPINLFMPGLWEVTLAMTADDGSEDEVVFRFCVEP